MLHLHHQNIFNQNKQTGKIDVHWARRADCWPPLRRNNWQSGAADLAATGTELPAKRRKNNDEKGRDKTNKQESKFTEETLERADLKKKRKENGHVTSSVFR